MGYLARNLEAFLRNLLLNEKNELHNRNLHISGLLNEEKVDIGDTKVDIGDTKADIENAKVDIQDRTVDIESVLSEKGSDFSVKTTVHIHRLFEKFGFDEVFGRSAVMEILELKGSVRQNFFPIWYRQILLNRYPVMEKEDINSRSSL